MSTASIVRAFELARPLATHDAASFFCACRAQSTAPRKRPKPVGRSTMREIQQRTFATSSQFRATTVKLNPRKDGEGNDMYINISERAAKRLKQIVTSPPKKNTLTSSPITPDSHLRVTVTAGGCHGFQYLMSLEPRDKIDPEEDTVFEFEGSSGDGKGRAEVVMDQPSLELLKGSTVDFTTELIGSQFKIVGNPRATSSCGCGTSFDIE